MHGEEAEGRDGLCLSFQRERLHRFRPDGIADECECRFSDQDLAGLRGLLQPRGDVDRIAGGQPLLRSGDNLAGIHPDAGLHAQLRERVVHLDRGAAGAQRIVLVHLRDAEDGHHRIADELLHRSPVRLHDRLHALEVTGEQRAQRFGVGRLAQRGRAGDVAEENGDRLALLPS